MNNPKSLPRRNFLKSTLAAGVTLSCPSATFLANAEAGSDAGSEASPDDLNAHLIWSRESVPVPVLREGHAVDIASSGNGNLPAPVADLHSIFVKDFHLDALPDSARIRLFAYTRYRLYINGKYLGRGPSRFQNQRPEYDTRNILAALHTGANRIAVLVHRDAPTGRIMRHSPGFAAVLELSQSGKTRVIPTDPTWLSAPDPSFGPRNEAWASIEEHLDLRKGPDLPAVSDPAFPIANWARSIPVSGPDFFPIWPRTTPLQIDQLATLNVRDFNTPLQLNHPIYLPLAQITQGYSLIEFDAEPGSVLELRYLLSPFGEEGESTGKCTCITRAGRQIWMGGDTFASFRVACELKSGSATIKRMDFFDVRYPFALGASLNIYDSVLSKLFKICANSLMLFSEDSYVDCADRERVEWTDDSPPAFDLTRVAFRGMHAIDDEGNRDPHFADNRLLKALLRRIALTQQPDGQLKAHSCSERFDIHAIMEDRSCDWVILLREYYESCLDTEQAASFVRELWPTLTRLMQWFLDRRTSRGLVQAREWEVWDNPLRYQVCEGAGLNAFVYRALIDAAYLGQIIGKTTDARTFATAAESLKSAFNTQLWNTKELAYDGALFGPTSKRAEQLNGILFPGPITGSWTDGRYHPTAQAALFALYCNIVPPERLAPLRTWLLAHLDEVKGPMSHYYLFRALYELNDPHYDAQVLYRMRIGWKAQVDAPWQTTWEDLGDSGGSKAHIYGITPGSFLITHLLGVRRTGHVSDRHILVEPRTGDLINASGNAITEFGSVPIDWNKRPQGYFELTVELPPGTHGTLRLYRSGEDSRMRIDTQMVDAQVNGVFVETPLAPGIHRIQYPVQNL